MSESSNDGHVGRRKISGLDVNRISAIWGFAEATLFFVVPDVWLTFAARAHLASGLKAVAWALGGALAGGLLMYQLGVSYPEQVLSVVETVPAVSEAQVETARTQLEEKGPWAIVLGPLTATPYKVYAVLAAEAGFSASAFLLWSIPARLPRFILAVVAAHFALRFLVGRGWVRNRTRTLVGFWLIFYAVFLSTMPW